MRTSTGDEREMMMNDRQVLHEMLLEKTKVERSEMGNGRRRMGGVAAHQQMSNCNLLTNKFTPLDMRCGFFCTSFGPDFFILLFFCRCWIVLAQREPAPVRLQNIDMRNPYFFCFFGRCLLVFFLQNECGLRNK